MKETDNIIGIETICLNWKRENAEAILMQAMMDETIRLRKARTAKERHEIRYFLRSAYEAIQSYNFDTAHLKQCLDDTPTQNQ